MSEHCQFIVIPVDRPPYVVDAHPSPGRVADELGAMAVALTHPGPDIPTAALWVRETCTVEQQPRNVMAALLLRILVPTAGPVPVLGPAVLTRLRLDRLPGGFLATVAEGLPQPAVEALLVAADDASRALNGADGGWLSAKLPPDWGVRVRARAEEARSAVLPPGYPLNQPTRIDEPEDLVAALMQKLGLGDTFTHVPIGH